MKTTIGLFVVLLLAVMLPGAWAQQSAEDALAQAEKLNQQAFELYQQGRYAEAIPLAEQALAIREQALGPEHPDVATSLNNLALLYAALNRPDQAHPLCLHAQQIHAHLIEQIMGFTSEAQKLDFLVTINFQLHHFLSLVSQQLVQNSSARKDGLDIWLQRKGVVLEAQQRFQDALVYSDDPAAVKTVQELAMVRMQLSNLAFAGPGKEGPEAYQQRLAELKTQKERLEAALSRLSQQFAVSRKVAQADTNQVATALPLHTAFLDFARVDMFNFKAIGTEERWQPAHYLVFLLFAGQRDDVRLMDLGDAATIDQAVAAFKETVTDLIRDRTGAKSIAAAQQVYQLVFAPLQKELGDVKEIFISPDGNLNLIPFEVLVDPDGHFLIETYTFNYLGAGRDLLGFGAFKASDNPPVLMGDPDFDLSTSPHPSPDRGGSKGGVGEGVEFNRSAAMRRFAFKRLPGTHAEVEAIQALLKGAKSEISLSNQDLTLLHLYTDKDAREEELFRHPSPRILHLATHGFFLEDQDLSAFVSPTRGEGLVFDSARARPKIVKAETSPPGGPLPQFENPLVRSGIVLAGANTAAGTDTASEGIVTAEKIPGLKLRGTELVVLSACETRLGAVQSGEGVFGLRRAFTQAGAKSLVMSLWSVPDKETKELMIRFYQNLLSGKLNRREALRQAALKQMQVVKDRYGAPHPFYWGAFVFLGEP
jgi:CHAT domain-containing protein